MYVNVIFGEEDEESCDASLVYIPEDNFEKIETYQQNFFSWLFNKDNNHSYWVEVDEGKKYCSYGVDAFIEWLNIFNCNKKKAYIVEDTLEKLEDKFPKIYF